MFYYAQIDESNICIGVSQLSGEVLSDKMILLTEYNVSLVGKRYNNGIWEDVEQPTPTPTNNDIVNAEILKILNNMNLKLSGGETNV